MILLTGGSGFVGKSVAPELSSVFASLVASNKSHLDLLDPYSVNRFFHINEVHTVIHAAGTVGGIGANKDNPGKFIHQNLQMGINLMEAIRLKSPTTKLVLLGTVCMYPKFTVVPFSESEIWHGYPEETNAPYGIAKKTLMEMSKAYGEQYGLNTVNLIPTNMYGEQDHFNDTTSHVIPAVILKVARALLKNEKLVIWGSGEATREFLYAPDLADALVSACTMDVSNEPINIGTGVETSIKSLVETICDIMGYDGEIEWDTTKPDGQPRRCLDVSRAKDVLDFTAKTDLNTGLRKTITHFVDSVMLKF